MSFIENKIILIVLAVLGVGASCACFAINVWSGIVCLIFAVLVVIAFFVYLTRREKQMEKLNNYLSLVCSGNYDLDISDNVEGELSILKNNIYKVVVSLHSSNDALEKDKLYLADSLADISHQLKTPLTSMMVMTDLIRNEPDAKKNIEFIDIIETQLDKMRWLIATLLKLSKIDAGTADFNMEALDVKSIIDLSLKPFLVMLDIKNINILNSTKGFVFNGDKNWSVEAIQNIIKNCIEHTADNGMLCFSTNCTNVYDELIISDNGCGIAKEDLPHIFERFYHGKNASADSVGIGLALSKEIMQKQRAKIDVKSSPKGTEFSIKFYKSLV